jgi:hypothetical protein
MYDEKLLTKHVSLRNSVHAISSTTLTAKFIIFLVVTVDTHGDVWQAFSGGFVCD